MSKGYERGDSCGVTRREDDIRLIEESNIHSISRRLRRDGDLIRLRLLSQQYRRGRLPLDAITIGEWRGRESIDRSDDRARYRGRHS